MHSVRSKAVKNSLIRITKTAIFVFYINYESTVLIRSRLSLKHHEFNKSKKASATERLQNRTLLDSEVEEEMKWQ